MRQFSIIFFLACLSMLASTRVVHAQATATGRVIDSKTGRPLTGAHVYLSGSTVGTATNLSGEFRLGQIPPGGYRLVISRIGYATKITDIVIGPTDDREFDFELTPVVYELPEIYVGDLDKKWEKNLERFKNHFIGESEEADSVKILNPEVLRFETKWWGKLTAEALAPLRIENRALGYHITYHLKEFEHTGIRTRWDGEPLFTKMEPVDSAQAAYWERNRKEAFNGSLRHFLLALLTDRVTEEGFKLYNIRERAYGYSSERRGRTSAERLIREGNENYLHRLSFFGRLEIIYTQEGEDEQYIRWLQNQNRRPASMQTSYLELNERPVTLDSDGEIIQPYGATQFGYYAYSRLANLTPRGYRPEGYDASNEE